MPFNTTSSEKNILKFQNNVEDIFVHNVMQARDKSIRSALAKAKTPQEIPSLVKVGVAIGNCLDFTWNQGMYAGIMHCGDEITRQVNSKKSLNFSLSYGLNGIINFADSDDQPRPLTREETEIKQKKANDNRLRGRRNKRDEVLSNINELNTEQINSLQVTNIKKQLSIAEQTEIYNTLNNRYSALSSQSQFSTLYLERRKLTLSTYTEKSIQDSIKENISRFISEKPSGMSNDRLLKDLVNMYDDKPAEDVKSIRSEIAFAQSRLRDTITRKEWDEGRNQIENNPQVRKFTDFVEEEELILNEAIERGDSKEEIAEIRADLEDSKRKLAEAKNNAAPKGFNERFTPEVTAEIIRQEEAYEEDLRRRSKLRGGEIETLTNIRGKTTKATEEYRDALIELATKPRLDEKKRETYYSGEISDKDLTKKELRILREYENAEAKVNKKKSLISSYKDQQRLQSLKIEGVEQGIKKQEDFLENGEFGVTIPSRGKTTKLSKRQKDMLVNILDLKSEGAIKALDKDFSITDLKKLNDRVIRKSDPFGNAEAVDNARRLAITEVSAAYNIGRLQAFVDNGVSYVQWMSKLDSKTSVFCKGLDKKVFSLKDVMRHTMWVQRFPKTKEPEYSAYNRQMSPRGVWVPPAHPYCRSYFQPVYLREDEKFLERDIKDKQLLSKMVTEGKLQKKNKNRSVRGLLKHQQKVRENNIKREERSYNLVGDLFKSGVKAIVSRFAQEGIAAYKEERIFEDDKSLVSVLLGGTVVLGTASMMYFFLRGNLADTLKKSAKRALSPDIKDTKKFLGNLTKKQTAGLTEDILNRLEGLGPATRGSIEPPNAAQLAAIEDIDINSLLSGGDAGYALALNGVPLDEITKSLISKKQLALDGGRQFTNKLYRNILSKTRRESSELNRKSLDLITQSFGNLGVDIDMDNIKEIQLWANGTANVIPVKGKATLVSGEKLKKALSSNKFRSQVIDTSRNATRMRRVLKEMEKDLEAGDALTKVKIKQEIKKLDKLVSLQRLPQLKMTPVVKDLADDFDEILNLDIVKQADFTAVHEGYESYSKSSKTVLDRFKSNLPEDIRLTADVSQMSDRSELQSLLEGVDNSIERVRDTYFIKSGDVYKPGRIEDIIDVKDILLGLEEMDTKFKSTSIDINYSSTVDKINKVVSDQMSDDYNFLLKRKIEIRDRIKQLE